MKRLDITEKLSFEEKPVLVIKDKEIELDNSAPTVLKVMGLMGEEAGSEEILQAYELLFDKQARKVVEALHLTFNDFAMLIHAAVRLVAGSDDEAGE